MSRHGPLGFDRVDHGIDEGTRQLTAHLPPGGLKHADVPRNLKERLNIVVLHAVRSLEPDEQSVGELLRTDQVIGAMAQTIGHSVASRSKPIWIADAVQFCFGPHSSGEPMLGLESCLRSFAILTTNAERENDLRRAGYELGAALTELGIGTVLLWFIRRAYPGVSMTFPQAWALIRSVKLNPRGREIAFWSGIDPGQIPERFASLERMLDETPAGQAFLAYSTAGKPSKAKDGLWRELSARIGEVAADDKRPLHYFVGKKRGFYDAMFPTKGMIDNWWATYLRDNPQLAHWSRLEIEQQYYAMHRSQIRGGRVFYENEIFHMIEKIAFGRGYWLHEIDEAGRPTHPPRLVSG
jgi:hypothetical protein